MPISNGGGSSSISSTTFSSLSGGLSNAETINASAIIALTASQSMSGEVSTTFDGWDVQDVKYTIVNFVVDTANTSGHFEDAEGNSISLGSGKTNPFITAYLRVYLEGDEDFVISSISGDGTASNAVAFKDEEAETCTLPEGTYAVEGIYGAEIIDGKAEFVKYGKTTSTEFTPATTGTDIGGRSVRIVLPELSGGNAFRVTLDGDISINKASIGLRNRQGTCDDWTFSVEAGENGCPQREETEYDGGGDWSIRFHSTEATVTASQAVTVEPSESYDFSIRAWSYEEHPGIMALQTLDGETASWYTFTGPSAGTWVEAEQPGNDCIYSMSTTGDVEQYSITGIEAPSGTSINIIIGSEAGEASIHFDDCQFYKTGTTTNLVSNGSFEDWTLTIESANVLGSQEDVLFDGSEEESINGTTTSDWVPINIIDGEDYILVLDVDSGSLLSGNATASYYISKGAAESAGENTVQTSDYDTVANKIAFVTEVEVGDFKSPSGCYTMVGNTNLVPDSATNVYSIDISGGGNGGIIFSFDEGKSFKAYLNERWVTLVTSKASDHGGTEGNWYFANTYDDGAVTFAQATGLYNNAKSAICLCLAYIANDIMEVWPETVDFSDEFEDGVFGALVLFNQDTDYGGLFSASKSVSDFSITTTVTPSTIGSDTEGVFVGSYEVGAGEKEWIIFHAETDPINLTVYYI